MNWEPLYTIMDFWDCPRSGVACVQGIAHAYTSVFDEAKDDYLDTYLVSPIEPEAMPLILENWDIWVRWESAYQAGLTTIETHPVLPEDRPRHEEIKKLLRGRAEVDRANYRSLRVDFRRKDQLPGGRDNWEAAWHI